MSDQTRDFEDPELPPSGELDDPWAEALLHEPLARAGVTDKAEEAARVVQRSPGRAAELLAEVAVGMDKVSPVIAELYRERAADAYSAAGESQDAAALLVQVTRSRIERAASSAPLSAQRLATSSAPVMGPQAMALPKDQRWLGDALLARADWPEHLPEALEALRLAAAQTTETPEEPEWSAALLELLAIAGEFEEAIGRSNPVRQRWPLAPGYRVNLELSALDAVEKVEGAARAEAQWKTLLAWATDLPASEATTGARIWQRRGVTMAFREQAQEAGDAFLRGARLWGKRVGYEDQVAEAYFASQFVGQLAGELRTAGSELRPVAASLRGNADTPAARADRLEEEGMRARLNEKLFEARRSLWLAYAEHQRAGNLRGQLAVMEQLGDLFDEARRPVDAVRAYVTSARDDKAKRAARKAARADDVVHALKFSGPKWQRAPSFAVVGAVGRRLSDKAVAKLSQTILAEAEEEAFSMISPQPSLRAREALAAVALGLPKEYETRGLALLRDLARGEYIGTARPAAEALVLLTNAGRSDETQTLVEAFVADAGTSGVSTVWVGGQLAEHEEARRAIRRAALSRQSDALEAAALADLPANDPEISEASRSYIERITDARTLNTEKKEEGYRSVSMASYEGAGIVARVCPPDVRRRFLDHMLDVATDDEDLEMNRASASHAIFNLARDISPEEAGEALERLAPLALGDYGESVWDEGPSRVEDPFVRFDLSFGQTRPLRAAALQALGALAGRLDDRSAPTEEAVQQALLEGTEELAAAAYQALARAPRLPVPEMLEAAFGSDSERVRLAALRCWLEHHDDLPGGRLLDRLLTDRSVLVRLVLLNAAARSAAPGSAILKRLCSDEDAYVRALAQRKLQDNG